jgi:hypothetical protein
MLSSVFGYVSSFFGNTTETDPYKGIKIDNKNKYNENKVIRSKYFDRDFFCKEYKDVKELIISYYQNYPEEFFLRYPELCIKNLKLNDDILKGLPKLENRKREHIRNWMFHSKLSLEQFVQVGF